MLKRTFAIAIALLILDSVLMSMVILGNHASYVINTLNGKTEQTSNNAHATIKDSLDLTGIHKEIDGVNSKRCIACHGKMQEPARTKVDKDTRPNVHLHLRFLANKPDCKYCHRTGRVSSSAGGKAAAPKAASCVVVKINNDFCYGCHKKEKPASHDKNWRAKHRAAYEADPERCNVCHTNNSCAVRCHTAHSAGMIKVHPIYMKKKFGQEFCMHCHCLSYCEDCHTKSKLDK